MQARRGRLSAEGVAKFTAVVALSAIFIVKLAELGSNLAGDPEGAVMVQDPALVRPGRTPP